MPWQDVPGQSGTRWRPLEETLADPNYIVNTLPDGTMTARERPGFWIKALPWIIGGGMGYGALANAGLFGAAAAGGGGGGSAAGAGGLLPSYGPTAAMQTAGAALPSVSAVSPAAALAGGGITGAQIANGASGASGIAQAAAGGAAGAAGRSGMQSLLDNILKYAPLGLAGASAIGGITQGRPAAENQLNDILRLAQGRMEASQPMFEALQRMTMAQLPKYARGEQ